MQTHEPSVLPERPSRPQQRFEERYAEALASWGRNGFRWEIGPVEPLPPDEHYFSRLALHVQQAAGPWRWICVSHEQAGPLGYLALFFEGNVRDESGQGLSVASLMAWGANALEQACWRILHQNRINTAHNEQNRAKARHELTWVRAACIVTLLCALVATGVARALDEGWLRAENDCLYWLALGLGIVAGLASQGLGLRWWQLHKWLALPEPPAFF